jgi:putative ABC transport system permease protein
VRRQPVRSGTWIATIAVALAAAVLWVAFGLHYAIQGQIAVLLDRIGANVFYVHHEDHRNAGFTAEDLARVSALPEVATAAGEGATSTAYLPGAAYALTFFEASAEYLDLMRLPFAYGEGFQGDERHVAVLGAEVARVVFGNVNPVGQQLEGLRIVGVLPPVPEDDTVRGRLNRRILVPLGASPVRMPRRDSTYWALWIRPSGSIGAAVRAVASEIPDLRVVRLSKRYSWTFSAQQMANRLLLFATGGLFALAGTIVAATLFLSSLSRRREIGVRRAVGAREANIAWLVVRDAIVLTLGAGLIGILISLAAFPIADRFGISLEFGLLHLSVLPLLVVLGIGSSLLPAVRSLRIAPVRALAARGLLFGPRCLSGGGFVVVAASAAIGACALYVFLLIGAQTLRSLDTLWGEIDERTLLVSAPRNSILYPPNLTGDDRDVLDGILDLELVVVTGDASVDSLPGWDKPGIALTGVGPGYDRLNLFHIAAGHDLTAEEIATGTQSIVLSQTAATELFGTEDAIGRSIQADGNEFQVVGVFSSALTALTWPTQMVAPYGCLARWPDAPREAAFWVRAASSADPTVTADRIVDAFRSRYPGRADVATVAPAATIAVFRTDLAAISHRLTLLIAAALLLGGANTNSLVRLYLAQRTRELGIRRAVGANGMAIVRFGVERGLRVAAIATVIGLACGVAVVEPLAGTMKLDVAAISVSRMLITCVAQLLLGGAAGAAAGWLAACGTPAAALRRGQT